MPNSNQNQIMQYIPVTDQIQGEILSHLLWEEYTSLEELYKFTNYSLETLNKNLSKLLDRKMIISHPKNERTYKKIPLY